MSTLCCAVVVGGGDALSPMRIRVPSAAAEPVLSGDDGAATTPEASTDSDSENDSSFESDEDSTGDSGAAGRKPQAR